MAFYANILFLLAAFFVFLLLVLTFFLPAKIIFGLPVMMWLWFFGMLIFGALIAWGVKQRDG